MSDVLLHAPAAGAERSLLIDDAAQLLGVSRRTVYYRIRSGRLRTIRTRCGSQRVLVSSLEALMREEDARRRRRLEGRTTGRRRPAA
jgi:excisionase family DNA binding protein